MRKTKKINILFVVIFVCMFTSAITVKAEEESAEPKLWSASVGLGVGYGSSAISGKSEISASPFFKIRYKKLSLDPGEASYELVDNKRIKFNFGLGYDGGRDEDDLSSSRKGVGDVDGGLLLKARASYVMYDWLSFNLGVSQSYSDAKSLLVNMGAGIELPLNEMASFNVGVSARWANEDHMVGYYGVNATQAGATGFNQYVADAGIEKVSVSMGVNHVFNESWKFNTSVGAALLQSDAADSPITEEEISPFVSAALIYSF